MIILVLLVDNFRKIVSCVYFKISTFIFVEMKNHLAVTPWIRHIQRFYSVGPVYI